MSNQTLPRLDDLAQQRFELRERKRALNNEIAEIDRELDENEIQILEVADALGMKRFAVGKLTFSVSENVVGSVEDWDKVYEYIKENDAFYLLQRRLANAAFKEMLDDGNDLPGVVPFVKRSINMRASA